ncbi:MAG TPA: cysteine dioxygenase family protein [Thermoleophilaceae bacterium]|jgi:predicted metal-dependent enzyme (double-stranded beta helix superfamily)
MSQALGSPIAPPRRLLDRPELLALVRDLAARREWWAEGLDTTSSERTYAALHRDEHLDVWAIAWRPENDTGWHDHDTSSGAVQVVDGLLTEAVLHIGGAEVFHSYGAGDGFSFAPTHIHRLTCDQGRAVSIHAYSPPLSRLGQYTIDDVGALLRVTVSDADELRALDVAHATVHA